MSIRPTLLGLLGESLSLPKSAIFLYRSETLGC